MKPEFNIDHCRPFNLEHAKDGAPYCQRSGRAARIGIWDSNNPDGYTLAGVRTNDDESEYSESWDSKGKFHLGHDSGIDLVMLPIGYCQGKPVHFGDILVSIRNHKVLIDKSAIGANFDLFGLSWPVDDCTTGCSTLIELASKGRP